MFWNSSFASGFLFTNVTSAAAVTSSVNCNYIKQFLFILSLKLVWLLTPKGILYIDKRFLLLRELKLLFCRCSILAVWVKTMIASFFPEDGEAFLGDNNWLRNALYMHCYENLFHLWNSLIKFNQFRANAKAAT